MCVCACVCVCVRGACVCTSAFVCICVCKREGGWSVVCVCMHLCVCVCVCVCVLGETQTGSIPSCKLMKGNSPGRYSHHNSDFHFGDGALPLLGVMGLGNLQCKDGGDDGCRAALSCSGALLPSSFGKVTDFQVEKAEGERGSSEVRGCDCT